MKIISLNIWGGSVYEPFLDFVKKYSKDVDVFCFQEVYKSSSGVAENRGTRMNILADLEKILPDFKSFFYSVQDNWDNHGPVDFQAELGQTTFIKNIWKAERVEHFMICGEKNSADPNIEASIPGGMICSKIKSPEGIYTICNIHGAAYPGNKQDTPERIAQSEKIRRIVEKENNKSIILCGDFNLLPGTKSIQFFAKDMQNLIKKYNILRTRGKFSPYFGKPDEQKFADYMFVSPDTKVKDFQVLSDEVSDHLALYAELSKIKL